MHSVHRSHHPYTSSTLTTLLKQPPHGRQLTAKHKGETDKKTLKTFEDVPPSIMNSQEELCFVTWNTRGIKSTRNSPEKLADVLKLLEKVGAKIAFIQETHVGPKCYSLLEKISGWKVYFTVYKPERKGVAILIRDDVPFEYICHDEDHSGGYIVLFCHLYGELYTLVNVYHHNKDRSVLKCLRDYLQETAEGVLVVGGDFNTVLDPYFDRRSDCTGSSSLRSILEDFILSLNLRDTWAHLHPTEMGFTRSEGNSASRLDMFFMPENIIGMRVSSCEIYSQGAEKKISDHDPVVLTLRIQQQSVYKIPAVASMLDNFQYKEYPDRTSEKISGAEILSAIKSLIDSGEQRPNEYTIDYYKQRRCPLTETLKIHYNLMLKDKCIPLFFKKYEPSENDCIFNVDYLIFSQILARRLMVLITPSFRSQKKENLYLNLKITFANIPKKIKSSFLMNSLTAIQEMDPTSPFGFRILENLLPDDRLSFREFRLLPEGCPLTNPILSLALKHLQDQILKTNSIANVCSFRQALFIQTEKNTFDTIYNIMSKFREDSGIELTME